MMPRRKWPPPEARNLRVVVPASDTPQEEEVTIRIDEAQRLATVILTGRATAHGVVRAIRDLTSHPQYRPGIPKLWDARQADLSKLTRAEFRSIARAGRVSELSTLGIRVAVLVTRPVDFGIARMFELSEGYDLLDALRVFRDPDAAIAWLTQDEK